MVFNLDTSPYVGLPETNNVIISVIDFDKRNSIKEYRISYEKYIKDCCVDIIKKGCTPVLMSFCKAEGDEVAIDRIYEQLPENLKLSVQKYFYDGNIGNILEYISSSKYIIGTRFHSMILAIVFNKPFYCIAYNKKIINVLEDLNCDAYVLPETLEEINANELFVKYSKPLVANDYMREAENQFLLFEQYLKNEFTLKRRDNDT